MERERRRVSSSENTVQSENRETNRMEIHNRGGYQGRVGWRHTTGKKPLIKESFKQ